MVSLKAPPTGAVLSGSDGTANSGDTINLSCSATGGFPNPDVELLRDGTVLTFGVPPQTHSLTVNSADDGAVFFCVAFNSAGNETTSLTLDISCMAFSPSKRKRKKNSHS